LIVWIAELLPIYGEILQRLAAGRGVGANRRADSGWITRLENFEGVRTFFSASR
jgi:hypothetical protein